MRRRLTLVVAAAVALAVAFGLGLGRRIAPARIETLAAAVHGVHVAPAPPALPDGPVENVVLCLGDGLGVAQLAAGRIRAFGPDGRLALERLPVGGLVATHSASSLVTKSDAAATAFAAAEKTVNGRIGLAPDGRRLASFVERFRARGGQVGLVTTSRLTDATPAAFAAHVERRRDEERIAAQLLDSGVELLLGGGRRFFLPASARGARRDGRDLLAEARARGTQVIERGEELAGARLPLLGLFAADKLPLEAPRPTLEEMARPALALLGASGRPFFLLLEDEGIDSAGHQADLAALGETLLRFDAAVAAAVEFAAADGRTLVVVVGDHGTGGLAIEPEPAPGKIRVSWRGDLHTGEPVPLFAYGPGAGRFAGLRDNTEVGATLAELLGAAGGS